MRSGGAPRVALVRGKAKVVDGEAEEGQRRCVPSTDFDDDVRDSERPIPFLAV